MDKIVDVKYVSCWEDCVSIETTAKVNMTTGEIVDIESIDVDDCEDCECEICVGEFVAYQDGSVEQVITTDDNRYFIISKSEEPCCVIEIHDDKYTISEDMSEDDIHSIYGIAY